MKIENLKKDNIKIDNIKRGNIIKLLEDRGWVGVHRLIIKNNDCKYQCLSLDVTGCSLVPKEHDSLGDLYDYYKNDIECIYTEKDYSLKLLK